MGDIMIPYKSIENVINKYFSDQMFHRPFDVVLEDSKVVKKKYFYPCELQQTFEIDFVDVITHHYGCKYDNVIFYFPGGAFTDPPTFLHYRFAKKISKKLKKRVVMFQYPLFPEVDPNITVKFIRKIMDFYKFENITFMGDSAGANLCMYILRSLHQDDINIIKKIVLISPFVEGSMNNAHISLISSYDFILDVDNCKKMCEQLYSIYLKDGEKLFPQSNEFKFESNVLIISGGHEIVTPDIYQWMLNQNILKVIYLSF